MVEKNNKVKGKVKKKESEKKEKQIEKDINVEVEGEKKDELKESEKNEGEKKLEEQKLAVKEETKKIEKESKSEKKYVFVRGLSLPISKKHAVAICRFIKGKRIEIAIREIEEVVKGKKAIPMKGELPHRKGMERGRYPINAAGVFIKLLKSLDANTNINNLGEVYISVAKADKASRPYRRFGSRRFKRTNVILVASKNQRFLSTPIK